MNSSIGTDYLNQQIQINLESFLVSLLAASILSFLIQLVYIKYSNSLSNKIEFSKNFILLALSTDIVITIVKSSLALSLGLVGALSIVRFRAAIKDPEELIYLFLIIATGLGCGAGQIKITILGIISSLIIIIILSKFPYFGKKKIDDENLLNVCLIMQKKISSNDYEIIKNKIQKFCKKIVFVSLSINKDESTINFDMLPNHSGSLKSIIKEINSIDKNIKVLFTKDNYLTS